MLRRRESAHHCRTSLPSMSAISSSSSSYGSTPLPAVRNHSVATSNPSYHEHAKVVGSYFSRASSSSRTSSWSSNNTKSSSIPTWLYYIPALLLMIIPWLSPHHLKDDIQNYQTEILALQQKQQELVKDLDTMTLSIKEYNTKIHVMNKENNAMFQDLRENGGVHTQLSLETEQYAEVEKAEEGLFRRLDDLEKYIQKTSAKLAAQKFGSEPYRVKVNVEDLRGDMSSFVIDLAPTTEMPYAVYHFLQMVDQNLWDGLALMLNGGTSESSINQHWMATTMKMDIRYGHHAWAWEGQRFENANLTHMAFTEHSTTYPPPGKFQYSVAFSGHPGGPSFCIRLDEDSQEEHITDIHQQSSTFGIVVEGMDVLQRYNQQSNIDPNDEAKDKHAATSSQHFEMLTIKSIELLSTL